MSAARARIPALLVLACTACGHGSLTASETQQAIASSRRFREPQSQTVRSRYCAAPVLDPAAADLSRLRALQDAGAIRVDRHPAPAGECVGIARPVDAVIVTLTATGRDFHPQPLSDAPGWQFPLGERAIISIGAITYNQEDPPTLAHVQYQWKLVPTLLGQLLQLSDAPQSASAAFRRANGEWRLADVGF
jgi:hypothetical protein